MSSWDFENELSIAKSLLKNKSDLSIFARPEWGSQNTNHRLKIREALVDLLAPLNAIQKKQILNLDSYPNWFDLKLRPNGENFVSASISHCEGLGGFSLSSQPVGFDILNSNRFSEAAVRRISSQGEIKVCPDLTHLWPAKEAAFKLLSSDIKVLSDLQINEWSAEPHTTPLVLKFSGAAGTSSLSRPFWGISFKKQNYIIALSFFA